MHWNVRTAVACIRESSTLVFEHLRNISVYMYILWNLSIEDTIRTQQAFLYREVSLLQR